MEGLILFGSFLLMRFYIGYRVGKGYSKFYLDGKWMHRMQLATSIGGWLISYLYMYLKGLRKPKISFAIIGRFVFVLFVLTLFVLGMSSDNDDLSIVPLMFLNVILQFTGHFILVGGEVLVELWELGDNPLERNNLKEDNDDSNENNEGMNKTIPNKTIPHNSIESPLTSLFSNSRKKKEISIDDAHKRLLDLKDLLDKGIITQEEFDKKSKEYKDLIL